MTCPRCGRESPAGTSVCPFCGATLIVELTEHEAERLAHAPVTREPEPRPSIPAPTPEASWTPPSAPDTSWAPPIPHPPAAAAEPQLVYAGFWRRWLAALLDGIVLFALAVPFFILWIMPHAMLSAQQIEGMSTEQQMEIFGAYCLYGLVSMLTEFLYFGLMESSKRQATLGRMAVGIRVADVHGRRIHLGRAIGRRLARLLSGMTLAIGFLIQPFTRRRQALHDKIAGTLVVRDPS